MKNFTSAVFFTLLGLSLSAQVPQKIIVEHFTNTRCGICSSRNPGFYTNLENQGEALHISFHPSSPYSNCVLNNHNSSENDARTNYYNNYGSTPKFVVQGDRITGGIDVSKPELFTPYEGMTSPVELKINQQLDGTDSIHSEVVVKAVASNTLGTVKLFVAVAEDTVFYNAPNGENEHYDVFREAMTAILGDDVTVPANAGDSVVLNFSLPIHSDWDVNHVITIGILQDASDKSVIQAEATNAENIGTPVGISENEDVNFEFFPNPTSGNIILSNKLKGASEFKLFNQSGKLVYQLILPAQSNGLITLPENIENGLYFGNLTTSDATKTAKILLQR